MDCPTCKKREGDKAKIRWFWKKANQLDSFFKKEFFRKLFMQVLIVYIMKDLLGENK